MRDLKRTLWTGAHPDDVFIGGAMNIRRNVKNSQILTVNTGVIASREFPVSTGGFTFGAAHEYAIQRLLEDRTAMEALGINLDTQYTNLQIPDIKTHPKKCDKKNRCN